jgi:hypothetical protein
VFGLSLTLPSTNRFSGLLVRLEHLQQVIWYGYRSLLFVLNSESEIGF